MGDAPNVEISKELLENPNSSKNAQPATTSYPFWFSKRFTILILLFFGFFFAAVVRVCINIAVIEMSTNKTLFVGNETIQKAADFNWDSVTVGLVLSSQSYGLAFSAIGGYFSVKFGGSTTYGVSLLLLSIMTVLNPLFLNWNLYLFLACRVLTGILDGCAYACSAEIFSRWIPLNERSTFMAIIFGGVYIGVAVTYPVAGYVAYFWGWQMIFYIAGGITLIWSIIWLLVVKNQPSKDLRMSKKELEYILSRTETTPRKEIVHPYKKIFTSPAVWALGVAKLTYGWGYSIIIISLPLYIKDVTRREINEIGIIASLPNLFCIFMTPVVGASMDYLQNNHNLRPSQVHKAMMTFGFITSSILFGVATFSNSFSLSMTCFILIKIFLSFNFLILQLICLYMAPKHSSVLLGLSAAWYLLSLVAVPTLVGFIVVHHNLQEWNMCFSITTGVLISGAIVYMIYGSSDLQPWAISPSTDNEKKIKQSSNISNKNQSTYSVIDRYE